MEEKRQDDEKREKEKIMVALENYAVEGEEEKAERIGLFLKLLEKRRDWAGLVSRACAVEAGEAVADSLMVLRAIKRSEECGLVDIGSGSGIVGIVLAIACPKWKVTLVESSARKSAFVAEVIGSLKIKNARVYNGRAEEMTGRYEFDAAVTRAVGDLEEIAPTALALVRPGGRYVALKGLGAAEEVKHAEASIGKAGGRIMEILTSQRAETRNRQASLVVIDKM